VAEQRLKKAGMGLGWGEGRWKGGKGGGRRCRREGPPLHFDVCGLRLASPAEQVPNVVYIYDSLMRKVYRLSAHRHTASESTPVAVMLTSQAQQ
jgi:hypothetical protein